MPTYEYLCLQCQHRFELRQGFADPPQAACPRCGHPAQRRFQPPALLFKGNGWYSTDHRRSSFEAPREEKESPSGEQQKTEAAASAAQAEAGEDSE